MEPGFPSSSVFGSYSNNCCTNWGTQDGKTQSGPLPEYPKAVEARDGLIISTWEAEAAD